MSPGLMQISLQQICSPFFFPTMDFRLFAPFAPWPDANFSLQLLPSPVFLFLDGFRVFSGLRKVSWAETAQNPCFATFWPRCWRRWFLLAIRGIVASLAAPSPHIGHSWIQDNPAAAIKNNQPRTTNPAERKSPFPIRPAIRNEDRTPTSNARNPSLVTALIMHSGARADIDPKGVKPHFAQKNTVTFLAGK